MIEAPRLLAPGDRQCDPGGGYPPLYVNPVDFAALYREKRAELMKAQAEGGPAASAGTGATGGFPRRSASPAAICPGPSSACLQLRIIIN